MDENLRTELKGSGWRTGTYRGFLLKRVAGIEFEIGADRGASEESGSDRLLLRWRYKTEYADRSGEETVPAPANRARVEDAMTAIYLRVHERPDPARFFGGGRRRPASGSPTSSRPAAETPAQPDDEEAGQTSLDF